MSIYDRMQFVTLTSADNTGKYNKFQQITHVIKHSAAHTQLYV